MEMVLGVPSVHSSIIYKSQEKAATYASTAVWMDREDVVYTDMVEDHPVIRGAGGRHPAISDNMDEPGRDYAEWNKSKEEKQKQYDFSHVESKIKQNKTTKT